MESGKIKNDINPFGLPWLRHNQLEGMWDDRKTTEDEGFEFYKGLRKTLNKEVDIYIENNAYELMHFISKKFRRRYEKARQLVESMQPIKPNTESYQFGVIGFI